MKSIYEFEAMAEMVMASNHPFVMGWHQAAAKYHEAALASPNAAAFLYGKEAECLVSAVFAEAATIPYTPSTAEALLVASIIASRVNGDSGWRPEEREG